MITIAWDVDDVINNLTQEWFEKRWLKDNMGASCSYKMLVENPPHDILGITKERYLQSLDAFRLSGDFQEMLPVPEIEQWFSLHGDNFRHMAITAVPAKAADRSAAWLLHRFGKWIREFHFIPSFREGESLPVYDQKKQELLMRIGRVDVFIDDNLENIAGVDKMGIKSFLFPRPWNKNRSSPADVLKELTEYAYTLNNKE